MRQISRQWELSISSQGNIDVAISKFAKLYFAQSFSFQFIYLHIKSKFCFTKEDLQTFFFLSSISLPGLGTSKSIKFFSNATDQETVIFLNYPDDWSCEENMIMMFQIFF